MKNWMYFLLLLCLVPMTGCAGCRNDIKARGGLLGEYEGDYIVISQSGGLIMDCYVLKNVYVQSETNSDGWKFTDEYGNLTRIGGDTKVIRIQDAEELDKWHEYHMEFETMTYREKFGESGS